jgi:thiol:disulfide interchange protein DsbD
MRALLVPLLLVALPLQAEDDFLAPEQAFRYATASDGRTVTVTWTVAPGYYLYLKRMGLGSEAPGVRLGAPTYPKGEIHTDEWFGEQVVFRGRFDVTAPIESLGDVTGSLPLALKLQGCADAGLCYPPTTWKTSVALPTAAPGGAPPSGIDAVFAAANRSGADEFLPPEEAFRLGAVAAGPDRVRVTWAIAEGYYLYRERLKFATTSDAAQLGAPTLPTGKTHTDEFFGTQEVYYGELVADVPVSRAPGGALVLPLAITYQGCADAGLCYPPITQTLDVDLPPGSGSAPAAGGFVSEQDRLAALIRDGNLFLVLATFFGLGLLLAFTPCVLPMVPILSGIIAGQGDDVTPRRGFMLSLAYVLGMAVTYTIGGALAAVAGAQIQALFQQPWILTLFALLFVVLALSMFGLFTIQMPAAVQTRLANASNQQKAGTFGGVAVMGALSALIVTTCVAPPLVATLAVIGQTGDVVRGASALFFMSLGMGTPLLAVGASAGKLLPKAGPWMDTVKQFFGVMLLAVAAWMLARVVPERLVLMLWAVPVFVGAWLLWRRVRSLSPSGLALRGASVAAAAYGLALLAGAWAGHTDPLAPLPRAGAAHAELPFERVKSVADLERAIAAASAEGRPVMLDFYADWCVSCKEMEKYTFTDSEVQAALDRAVWLQADVTANDADDQALLKHFGIFGPPTIAFYGADGVERKNYRVVGYMKAPEFSKLAAEATAGTTVVAGK